MMRKFQGFVIALATAGVFVMGVAAANTADSRTEGEAPSVMTLEIFQQQRALIERNLTGDGVYNEISGSNRRSVVDSLNLIEAELSRYGTVDNMTDDAKVRVFNEQEKINELLTDAARDSRVRCERRKRVGTNMRSTHCESHAERMRRLEYDTTQYRRMMNQRLPDKG